MHLTMRLSVSCRYRSWWLGGGGRFVAPEVLSRTHIGSERFPYEECVEDYDPGAAGEQPRPYRKGSLTGPSGKSASAGCMACSPTPRDTTGAAHLIDQSLRSWSRARDSACRSSPIENQPCSWPSVLSRLTQSSGPSHRRTWCSRLPPRAPWASRASGVPLRAGPATAGRMAARECAPWGHRTGPRCGWSAVNSMTGKRRAAPPSPRPVVGSTGASLARQLTAGAWGGVGGEDQCCRPLIRRPRGRSRRARGLPGSRGRVRFPARTGTARATARVSRSGWKRCPSRGSP